MAAASADIASLLSVHLLRCDAMSLHDGVSINMGTPLPVGDWVKWEAAYTSRADERLLGYPDQNGEVAIRDQHHRPKDIWLNGFSENAAVRNDLTRKKTRPPETLNTPKHKQT